MVCRSASAYRADIAGVRPLDLLPAGRKGAPGRARYHFLETVLRGGALVRNDHSDREYRLVGQAFYNPPLNLRISL
jgi:hypothetical protein